MNRHQTLYEEEDDEDAEMEEGLVDEKEDSEFEEVPRKEKGAKKGAKKWKAEFDEEGNDLDERRPNKKGPAKPRKERVARPQKE